MEENVIKAMKNKIDFLETELVTTRKMLGVKMEKKDPKAWSRLEALGKEISKSWKGKKPSWQLISESRR